MNDDVSQNPVDRISNLVLIGANHRSSTMGLRDRLFVEDHHAPDILKNLQGLGLDEAMVLSTCDRTEIVAVGKETKATADAIKSVLSAHGDVDKNEMDTQLYSYCGEEAIRHLFLVTASLDSSVVGEPQVLGQVKASHLLAKSHGMAGPCLNGVMQAAFSAAKKVRTETTIGERPVSIAAVAENIVHSVHGDLAGLGALLIGVGEMGELIATRFLNRGLERLCVIHPLERRAGMLARKLECHRAGMDELADVLAEADVVITALGKRHPVLDSDKVLGALKRRRQRMQLIIDVAIPGDVDAAVNRIDDCYLYDLGDLERIALEGLTEREKDAVDAHQIITMETSRFVTGGLERRAAPALKELRNYFENLREQALLDGGDDAEKATRLLINRILHTPMEKLRGLAVHQPGEMKMAELAIRRLFGLPKETAHETEHENTNSAGDETGTMKKEP